jgi:alanine racemase
MQTGPADPRGLRATRAIVDLEAIAGNVRTIRAALPDSTRIMAVVKADGYGHGAPWVARTAIEAGASLLGVATVGEGHALRACEITAPIVLLGSIDPSEVATACQLGLEITIAELGLLETVQCAVRKMTLLAPLAVHVKVDTGLRRYGAAPEEALAIAERVAADPSLRLASVFTHFASADEPNEPFTAVQLRAFERIVKQMRERGVPPPEIHSANSAGILTGFGVHHDFVRLGIALYGVPPSAEVTLPAGMRPALRVESRIARVIPIAPGDSVGYNRTYRAEEPVRGALIPIGYADGYRRSLSGRGWMGLHRSAAPVLGRVSMDQTVIAIPSGVMAQVGDAVHVLGSEADLGAPSVTEIAELMGTNAYEVLVGIRQRVPRVLVRGAEVVAVRTASDNLLAQPAV